MKQIAIVMLIGLGIMLAGCGGGSSSANTVTGNWTASLTNSDGTQAFALTTTLAQSNGTTLVTGTNLVFTTSTSCFTSGGSETGSFVLSGSAGGGVSGAFQLTIMSGTPAGNTLVMVGTVTNNAIAGTWTLTGTGGCTGSGNFTMTMM